MPAAGSLTQLVFECSDASSLAEFWRKVLDLGPPTGDPGWLTLEWEPVGRLSFHEVEGYRAPVWAEGIGGQQIHLDLLVEDFDASCAQVLSAGAQPLTDVLDPGPEAWRVFADPQGHPFCLVSVPE